MLTVSHVTLLIHTVVIPVILESIFPWENVTIVHFHVKFVQTLSHVKRVKTDMDYIIISVLLVLLEPL